MLRCRCVMSTRVDERKSGKCRAKTGFGSGVSNLGSRDQGLGSVGGGLVLDSGIRACGILFMVKGARLHPEKRGVAPPPCSRTEDG